MPLACRESWSWIAVLLMAGAGASYGSEALAAAPSPPEVLGRIDAFAEAERARQKIPGLALAVIKGGEVLKVAGYGQADVEHQVPVTAETVFQTGSVGKQFTAAAVMLLVEDGRLRLDDSIAGYFPDDAPESWKPITVRHLLTHTSGIPTYSQDVLDYRRDYTEDDLARVAYGMAPEFRAGSRWSYSNTGYILLGALVRRAGGRFYGDVLRDRVFGPLGMKTARVISEADIVRGRASGYRLVDGELKNQEWVSPALNTTADGSLYLGIQDYIAWDKGLRARAILKRESWDQVFEPVRLTSGKAYPYGFGWGVEELAGQKVQRHGGGWQGFSTHIARYLGSDLTIVVLANLAEGDAETILDGIAGIVDPGLAKPPRKPIPDREPAVTVQLRDILAKAAEGRLIPADFTYVSAGLFPGAAQEHQKLLGPLGQPQCFDLLERRELGDDRVYTYDVSYAKKTLRVTLGIGPDGKVSQFWPQER